MLLVVHLQVTVPHVVHFVISNWQLLAILVYVPLVLKWRSYGDDEDAKVLIAC
jgi:hypothetical protein